jgi:hypothetical protein
MKRRVQKTTHGADPAPIQVGQNRLEDGTEESESTGVQTDNRVGSDGQSTGVIMPPARDSQTGADPFDLDSLRLPQDFGAAAGVKRLITTIPVKKPEREWFVRTHPDPAYWLQTPVLELNDDREFYLVAPGLWPALASEGTCSPRLLATAINRQGVLFLWPIRLPGVDGKIDSWNQSALDAADKAKSQWTRVISNRSLRAYELTVASAHIAEPEWPDITFQEIIRIAFRDKMIADWHHPVLRRLRGEI